MSYGEKLKRRIAATRKRLKGMKPSKARRVVRKRYFKMKRKLDEIRKSNAARRASNKLYRGSRGLTNKALDIAVKDHGMSREGHSRKRSIIPRGSSRSSWHNTWILNADAIDLGTFTGEQLARDLARHFGASYQPHQWNLSVVTYKGKRYLVQILWLAPDGSHTDHVHFGAKRL